MTPLLLVALTAAPTPAPAPKDLLDALDFDNGAFLVQQAPSWNTGVGDWTAWRLTDGSPMGWCSPEGVLAPATFIWELDGAWALETFQADNTGTQEDGYPGISAKAVELAVADPSGSFRVVGTFALPKGGKASFPLPKGTTASRVRVTIRGNHGNQQYIELGELDLLGKRVQPTRLGNLSGVYATNYGPLRFVQDGDQVYGCYDWGGQQGSLWGTVSGRVAHLTWAQVGEDSQNNQEGTATFAVTAAHAFWGIYFWKDGRIGGEWTSSPDETEPPRCQPEKRGQLGARLKAQGRLALYGIRFDVNSDVPLAESEATLKELASVLAADPSLHLVVEGHTDSTNTDAYNLDLSNRRAKAVVGWLTGHGVPPAQLTSRGWGKSHPVADNATAQGRALNRRVEVARQAP